MRQNTAGKALIERKKEGREGGSIGLHWAPLWSLKLRTGQHINVRKLKEDRKEPF